MPVILREAKIGRIAISGQPGENKFVRLHLNVKKLDVVAWACYLSSVRKPKRGGWQSRSARARRETISPK
jgi:hypothetical protein